MMRPEYHIIQSGDGSDSVKIAGTNISFHSTRGAFTESTRVFIENGLMHCLGLHRPAGVSILEVGFGTGLNALLTLLALKERNVPAHYTGVDRYPLPEAIYSRLNYGAFTHAPALYRQLMQAPWNETVLVGGRLLLHKIETGLEEYWPDRKFDICFFDAFAPGDQPGLWTVDVFKKIRNCMNEAGVLVTYCSKSAVRKALQEAGFTVEKLKGPPGKREVVRAAAASVPGGH